MVTAVHGPSLLRAFGSAASAVAAVAVRGDASCFADEVVIDFPSVASAVDRIRHAFLADERGTAVMAAIQLSLREAMAGATVALEVPCAAPAAHAGAAARLGRSRARGARAAATSPAPSASGVGSGRRVGRDEIPLHRDPEARPAHAHRASRARRLELVASTSQRDTGFIALMERHVRLLGILAGVWAPWRCSWASRCCCCPLARWRSSWVPTARPSASRPGSPLRRFASIALFTLLWGMAHLWAASLLRRREPAGRVLMLGLAVVNLLVLPFGTALGAYALWVLMTNAGRRLFESAAAPQP